MLDVLTSGFRNARLKLQGKTRLTEENVADALREVRTSLIQADVEFGVVKEFIAQVKERALGEIVLKSDCGDEASCRRLERKASTSGWLAVWLCACIAAGVGKRSLFHVKYFLPSVCSMSSHKTS